MIMQYKLEILVLCKDSINSKVTIPHLSNVRHFNQITFAIHRKVSLAMYFLWSFHTGRIQIRVLTNCRAISTEIGTDSLKI